MIMIVPRYALLLSAFVNYIIDLYGASSLDNTKNEGQSRLRFSVFCVIFFIKIDFVFGISLRKVAIFGPAVCLWRFVCKSLVSGI